jgi:hypothetical protein
MNEERTPPEHSPDPILDREDSPFQRDPEPSSAGLKIAIVIFVLVAVIAAGYALAQHSSAQQLASEGADLRASLAQAKAQDDALTAKVNALSAAQAQQAQEEAARQQAEAARNEQFLHRTGETPRHTIHQTTARRAPVDDPRWKRVQEQLGNQQKELEANQKQIADTQANLDQAKSDMAGNLQAARTELGGDIARNHQEVVDLEKKGERNFYEFSFERSKTYHHAGPVSISLRKADSKHEYCDLQMLVDDREITRKHVNLYESITLYPEGYPRPLEVVVNHIDKNSVRGYVSEPKYRSTEQTSASANVPAATSASATPPTGAAAPEVQLEHR